MTTTTTTTIQYLVQDATGQTVWSGYGAEARKRARRLATTIGGSTQEVSA